jgi:hypothetical protein
MSDSEGDARPSSRLTILRERLGRQDYPAALRGLDPPGALPERGNYRSDAWQLGSVAQMNR